MIQTDIVDASIIIVSWNTRDYLNRCLSAILRASENLHVEIIVVDNGSTDGTQAMLAETFPHITLIQNKQNVGFGRAINIGVSASQGECLMFLNSDCELAPHTLQTMVGRLNQDTSLGIVFCRLVNPDGSLQPSVHGSFPSPWSTLGDLFFHSSLRYALYRRPALHPLLLRSTIKAHQRAHEVAWGGGACLVVRRKAFDVVGGFDEGFFMYCEDMDFCQRIRGAGFRAWYLPEAFAIHHWGRSATQARDRMIAAGYRSRILYFEKYFPGWGGAVVAWAARGELQIRRLLWQVRGLLPSQPGQAGRERSEATRECLREVRGYTASVIRTPLAESLALPLLLALVLAFTLGSYLHDVLKVLLSSQFVDFAHYYTYATVVAQGLNPFDPQAIAEADRALGVRRAGAAANYPPPFYLLMHPWALLPFSTASTLWLMTSQLCLVGAMAVVLRHASPPTPIRAVLVLFVVLSFQPLIETIALGQVNVVLLFLLALAWSGLRAGAPWLAAASITAAISIKVQFGLLVPLLWWIGHRAVALRATLLAGLVLGTSLLLLGVNHHLQYAHYVLNLPEYLQTWTANLSPRATFHRLLAPVQTGPALADMFWIAVSGGILIGLARTLPTQTKENVSILDWAWSLGITAVLLVSPLTSEHHLVVLLLPLTLLILQPAQSSRSGGDLVLLVGSILLLGSRYSLDQFPFFHQGLPSLLMTGKLLGIVLLVALLLHRLRGKETRQV